MSSKNSFFFDKTDLFNRIKKLETLLGLNNSFDSDDITTRVSVIEEALSTLSTTYTTRTYTDNKLLEKVNKTGDSLLGNLALLVQPTQNNHLVTKEYVDTVISELDQLETDLTFLATKQYVDDTKVSKFGDTLMGELVLANLATQPLHPVTKQQLDVSISTVAQTGNLDW